MGNGEDLGLCRAAEQALGLGPTPADDDVVTNNTQYPNNYMAVNSVLFPSLPPTPLSSL